MAIPGATADYCCSSNIDGKAVIKRSPTKERDAKMIRTQPGYFLNHGGFTDIKPKQGSKQTKTQIFLGNRQRDFHCVTHELLFQTSTYAKALSEKSWNTGRNEGFKEAQGFGRFAVFWTFVLN